MEKQLIKNQIALFNLLGALAEKLTGQTPSVFVEQEDGSLVKITPTTSFVTWAQVESIKRDEQKRLLNYLKVLNKSEPKASLAATIDLIEATDPEKYGDS